MFRMVDSGSDGMCGFVVMMNTQTCETARVRWGVGGKISSQGAAREEALRQLKKS